METETEAQFDAKLALIEDIGEAAVQALLTAASRICQLSGCSMTDALESLTESALTSQER